MNRQYLTLANNERNQPMKFEEKRKFKSMIPDSLQKSFILGIWGAAIGGGIGGYLSVINGNYIYGGIGAGIGYITGYIAGLLIKERITLQSIMRSEGVVNIILGSLGIILAVAGIVGFILTKNWIGIMGAVFFGLGGFYFLRK